MSLTIDPAKIVQESASPLLACPDGWPRQPLGETATILNGFAFKSSEFVAEGGKPLIRIRDIFKTETAVGYAGVYDERYVVHSGDLLVGMDGDFNCVRWSGPDGLLNQRVCKITPNPGQLDMEYLSLVLPGYLLAIHDLTSSTTVTHLSSRDVAALPIPVPALDEQRALATLVGSVSSKATSVRSHLTRAQRAIGRLRQALPSVACSGGLTQEWRRINLTDDVISRSTDNRGGRRKNGVERQAPNAALLPEIPEHWCWSYLSELGELARGKSRHRPRNDPLLYGGPYPFVQTGDVARSGGLITTHSQTYNARGLAQSRLWPTDTVCITIAANIAESALLSYPACFPDSVVGLIADASVVRIYSGGKRAERAMIHH